MIKFVTQNLYNSKYSQCFDMGHVILGTCYIYYVYDNISSKSLCHLISSMVKIEYDR